MPGLLALGLFYGMLGIKAEVFCMGGQVLPTVLHLQVP